MVGRRRRLGKYAAVCFAEPPWNEEHPDWIRLERDLHRNLQRSLAEDSTAPNANPLCYAAPTDM